MNARFTLAALVLLIGFSLALPAQQRHDPLTTAEADALREAAQTPEKRIMLLMDYAGERLQKIEKMSSDPKLNEPRNLQDLRNLLTDLAAIVDEIDDNLSAYGSHGADLRKSLRAVIDADIRYQETLQNVRKTLPTEVVGKVNIELADAADSLAASADSAQSMLEKQNQ